MRIRAEVEHPGDALHGPLRVRLIARHGDAKLTDLLQTLADP